MSHHESHVKGGDARAADRMLFFSDAVFAIVLTLLVLELRLPLDLRDEAAIQDGLRHLIRPFFAFTLSFALGAAFWGVHMRTTRRIKEFDWLTLSVNMVHLFTVTLLPFAAALLGERLDSPTAFVGYSSIIAAVSFTGVLLFIVATRDNGRLLHHGISWRVRIAGILRTSAIGFAALTGVIIMLYGNPHYAKYAWGAVIPFVLLARVFQQNDEL